MKVMPNINLSPSEYYSILKNEETHGGEGIISRGSRPNTLYKIFFNGRQELCPMSENKQRKVLEIYQKGLEYCVLPLATLSLNGEMVGYEMTRDANDVDLESLKELPREQMIAVLRRAKIALEYFASRDITYGDVTESNILINRQTGAVKFCDIDNMRVGEYPIDKKGFSLLKYSTKTGVIDRKADAYMHNLLTIRKLHYREEVYDTEILRDLNKGIYPTKFKLAARPIFKSMTTPETFQGEYAIQYIKR